jgi:hypothetical protein
MVVGARMTVMLESLLRPFTSPTFVVLVSMATLAGLIATLVSLRLALRSISDSKNIVAELKAVENSLTTRPIGESPTYCKDVTELVRDAKECMQITTMFPVIGIYSSPARVTVAPTWANNLRQQSAVGIAASMLFITHGVE